MHCFLYRPNPKPGGSRELCWIPARRRPMSGLLCPPRRASSGLFCPLRFARAEPALPVPPPAPGFLPTRRAEGGRNRWHCTDCAGLMPPGIPLQQGKPQLLLLGGSKSPWGNLAGVTGSLKTILGVPRLFHSKVVPTSAGFWLQTTLVKCLKPRMK